MSITKESSICFVSCIAKEWELGRRLINQIKFLFASSEIIIIFDGTSNIEFEAFCDQLNVRVIKSKFLKLQSSGGAFAQRFFETYLNYSSALHLVRVEPDTYLNKTFELPNTDVAGNVLQITQRRKLIQGGCVSFKRKIVKQIVASQLLNNNKYKIDPLFGYKRYKFPYLNKGEQEFDIRLTAEDAVFSDIIWQLGIPVAEWKEICCRVRQAELPIVSEMKKYSVVHPVKNELLCL